MKSDQNNVKMQIRGVTKRFSPTEGVFSIDLDVYEGELVTLLGPSGCGKTTLLRAIGGFHQIDEGEIRLDGTPIQNLPPEKRPTAMVFQSYNLWPHMTIYENMAFGLRLRKQSKQEIAQKVAHMLDVVKMPGCEKKYPAQLSGGQQQRIAIARALLLEPWVLLLDEPFSALDAKIRGQMREELKRIQQSLGITIVFVTHDQEEAMALSDRIAVMRQGDIEQVGTPASIYDNPENEFVAGFIGQMNLIEDAGHKVAVRPEDVVLTAPSEGQDSGEITHIMMLGHYAQILIRTKDLEIRCFLPREQATHYLLHQQVGVRYAKAKVF